MQNPFKQEQATMKWEDMLKSAKRENGSDDLLLLLRVNLVILMSKCGVGIDKTLNYNYKYCFYLDIGLLPILFL